MSESKVPLFAIVGPTASGKSLVAMELAHLIPLEIISVDSMQVYKGMNIGTAKPTAEECARVPHHCLDLVELHQTFDTGEYLLSAQRAEADIRARGKLPLYVGGTSLYLRALLHGLDTNPSRDEALREELEKLSLEELQEKVALYGPHGLNESDWKNKRRLIRAFEICSHHGKPLIECRQTWLMEPRDAALFCLKRDPADLERRVNARVEDMMNAGFATEVAELTRAGLLKNKTAMQAIGYKEVAAMNAGKMSREECVEAVKLKTRQFARKQVRWFLKENNMTPVDWEENVPAAAIAEQIAREIKKHYGHA
ncbi:tRNA (adenosine(37)-N6)-dimethylallyltransferase MiaA [Kamptonema cortianum]|nr:tRNA (adenosine(37)-N6)-dimethylallyltransferase MiaA [Kamptonema cortianum]